MTHIDFQTTAAQRAELNRKVAAMSKDQRRKRIREMSKNDGQYMNVWEVMEWICLTRKTNADEAEFLVKQYLKEGGQARWADDRE